MHGHKLNHVNINNANQVEGFSHDKPTYWNSLGVVTAYEGEVIEQNYMQTLPFLNQSQNSLLVCNADTSSKCMLEHVTPELLYVNGDSISILSEISPSLYLGTLLVIYLLSSVKIVSKAIEDLTGGPERPLLPESITSRVLYFIIGFVYVCGIVFAFGTTSKLVHLKWHDLEVQFVTTTHLASILISFLSIVLYSLHLKGRKLAWDNLLVPKSHQVENAELYPTPTAPSKPESVMSGQESAFDLQIPNFNMNTNSFAATSKGKFEQLPMTSRTAYDSMNFVAIFKDTLHGNEAPVSSESSVLGSFTVLLGAIGSLGLTRGTMLETEAQLIVACMSAFALLEICSHRLYAYFWFIRQQCAWTAVPDSCDIQQYRFKEAIYFVRALVLILQMFFILVWMNTVNGMIISYSALYTLFLSVAILFWICRAISWVYEASLYLANYDDHKGCEPGVMTLIFDWTSDVAYYVVVVVSVSMALFATTQYNGLRADDKLLQSQKVQYGALYTAKLNDECKFNFVSTSLLRNVLQHDIIEDRRKWHDNSEMTKADPVDLKVYYWTRWWTLQPYRSKDLAMYSEPSTWFCSSAFEHHHNLCQSEHEATSVKMIPDSDFKDRVLSDLIFHRQMADGSYESCEGTVTDCTVP